MELVYAKMLQDKLDKAKTTTVYPYLPQPTVLGELAKAGVEITSQTLRNWEKYDLLIPPRRSGQLGGRKSEYCEFSLAEAFAAYKLTQSNFDLRISNSSISLPKFSLAQLSLARKKNWEVGNFVPYYPNPPKYGEGVRHYNDPFSDDAELQKNLPDPNFRIRNKKIEPVVHKKADIGKNIEEILQYNFFQSLYIAWFYALCLGCEKFLTEYKES